MRTNRNVKRIRRAWKFLAAVSCIMAVGSGCQLETAAQEITTVKMMLLKPYCSEEEFYHVVEKINERLIEQLQLRLEIGLVNSGNEELMKYLMDNPDADIIYTGDFQKILTENLFLPLDDLLQSDGQDILSVLSEEYLIYSRRDGKQYGLPPKIELASASGVVMRTDLLEKYEIDSKTIQTWDDVGEVLDTIVKNEPDIYGIVVDLPRQFSPLASSLAMVVEEENKLEAVNYFATADFYEWAERIYDWGQKEYLYDLANYRYNSGATRGLLYGLMEEGYLFSYMVGYKPGIADQETKNFDVLLTKIQITPQVITNTSYQGEWGIYSRSTHPKEAMRILNFLYSDKEINNLFCWGIEGEHYQKDENGRLVLPDGKTQSEYFFNRNWVLPNGYIADVWQGDIPNLLEEVEKFNDEAEYAPDFEFWFDDSEVQVETERCLEVINAYLDGFVCGQFDPDEMIPMMLSELEDCGIERIIQEKQRQLDEWEAQKKNVRG